MGEHDNAVGGSGPFSYSDPTTNLSVDEEGSVSFTSAVDKPVRETTIMEDVIDPFGPEQVPDDKSREE